jgi:hypothetical protein
MLHGRAVLSVPLLAFVAGCSSEEPAPPVAPPPSEPVVTTPRFPTQSTLLLAQAQFLWETDAEGRKTVKPGPAKLVMLSPATPSWRVDVLEDPESRVFHKASCVIDRSGAPRIMTIAGTEALLKLWRVEEGAWKADTLWHPKFGGKWNRLRDYEIGDVDGDGQAEIVIGTHDQGVVAVLEKDGTGYRAIELDRSPETFIHEVELSDLDGDGAKEIYVTPSKPNKPEGSQNGIILGFRWVPAKKSYKREVVADLGKSHAKEILAADLNKDGRDELYALVEATRGPKGEEVSPVELREFARDKQGKWSGKTLVTIPGAIQARVLLVADLLGRGKLELVASTMKAGVWRLIPTDGAWEKALIDRGLTGFENAAGVADLDGDGRPELYVAADDQDEVVQFMWNGTGFDRRSLYGMDKSDLTWTILSCNPERL